MLTKHLGSKLLHQTSRNAASMAWYCSGSTNSELVENLFREGLIKDKRVKEAMMRVCIATLYSDLAATSIESSTNEGDGCA